MVQAYRAHNDALAQKILEREPSHAPTDPSNDYRTKPPALCFACNGYHGGVNSLLHCVSSHLAVARGDIVELQLVVRELEEALAKAKAAPTVAACDGS